MGASDLDEQVHFIRQCDALEETAAEAKDHLREEERDEALATLHQLRGRVESVIEDLDGRAE